jgi:hypothetical protein
MGPVCDALRKAQCDEKLGPLTIARVRGQNRNSLCCFAESTMQCKAETVSRGTREATTWDPYVMLCGKHNAMQNWDR